MVTMMEPKAKRIRSAAFKLEFPGCDEVKHAVKTKLCQIKAKFNAVFHNSQKRTQTLTFGHMIGICQ